MLAGTPSNSYKMSTTSLSAANSHDVVVSRSDSEINQDALGNEHYIHSRLRSILPSGPKEVATAYTGVITSGASLRRMASVNAEARTKLVYTPDLMPIDVGGGPDSPHGLRSPTRAATGNQPILGSPTKAIGNSGQAKDNLVSPSKQNHTVVPITITAGNFISSAGDKVTSRTSNGGVVTTAGNKGKSVSPKQYVIKDSFIEIEDVRKSKPEKLLSLSPQKPALLSLSPQKAALRSSLVETKPDYVKRIAAVNAQACVNAIMGYEYMTTKSDTIPAVTLTSTTSTNSEISRSGSTDVLGKRPSRQTGNSNQNNSKKKKESDRTTRDHKVPLLSTLAQTATPYTLGPLHEPDRSLHLELLSSSNEDDSPPPNEKNIGLLYYQEPAYNCLGLLYNSDTVHSNTPIYLTTEGRLPSVLIPPIIPQKFREVNAFKEKLEPVQRRRSKKGDNGWIAVGHPIKTIRIMSRAGGGGGDVERKYFIGVKRKDEELYVRDSIIVRSGRKENPYVAKIASIWQEKDGLILTVFWYYRPEDVLQNIATQFYPNEVMASQHHDDIGVACIDDKCQVFGYTQYCRYRANLERAKLCISPGNTVPPLCNQDIGEGVSFSVLSPKNADSHREAKETRSKTTRLTDDDDDDDDDVDDVYFCYRAFNHITGKIMRQSEK